MRRVRRAATEKRLVMGRPWLSAPRGVSRPHPSILTLCGKQAERHAYLLTVACQSISFAQGGLLAHEFALLGAAEIPLSTVVIHAGERVDPDHLIAGSRQLRWRGVGRGLRMGNCPGQNPEGSE